MVPLNKFPTFTVIVLYPRDPGTSFNLDYYLHSHIPLAEKFWGPHSMRFHSITPYASDNDYHLACMMEWDNADSYKSAQQDAGTKEVMDDVTSGRFTTVKPVFLT